MDYSNQQQSPPPSQIPTITPFQHLLQHHHHQQQLQMLWEYQRSEIENSNDFKNHQLPLARIKKIMKADEDVRMISAEAPVLFAKACELFILELTIRSWLNAEENKRRTLQKNDIAATITTTDIFDFLVDLVPNDHDIKEEGFISTINPAAGGAAAGVPYYYPPVGQPSGEVTYGQLAMDPSAYGHQPWQPMWHQQGVDDGGYSVDGQDNYNGSHHHHHPNTPGS